MPRILYVAPFALLGFCSLALAQAPTQPAEPGVAARADSPADWRFAHPDADVKISLNLQALLNSPAIAKLIEQGKSQAKDNAMQIELVLGMLKTVDRISISVRQRAAVVGKAAAGADMDVLAQVTGSFDSQLIAGFFPSTGAGKVKVVGPHTLLIGEGDSFAAAAERMAAGARMPAGELEGSDIWISTSGSFLAQQAAGANQPMPPFLLGLQNLAIGFNFGGLNLSDSPEINMLLTATDAAAATEMLKMFQAGTEQVGQLNPMAGQATKALTMTQDGSTIRIHFVVPPEMMALGQQMAAQQATSGGLPAQLAPLLGSLGLGGLGPAKPAAPPAGAIAPEPPPQNGGKIMIYGLDGGPKAIPVHP